MLETCTKHELIISDYERFSRISSQFTSVSDAHRTTSWLYHIFCCINLYVLLSDFCISNKLPISDHLPTGCNVCFDLDSTPNPCDSVPCDVKVPTIKVQWSKATDVEIEHYNARSYTSLKAITPPYVIKYINTSCNCSEHQMQLDVSFDSICNALYDTSKQTIPTTKIKYSSECFVPGFNDYLKELHTNARNSYLTWKQMGKPRGDDTDMYMRTTRLQFKYALRQCRI